jgi:hypothetical protein
MFTPAAHSSVAASMQELGSRLRLQDGRPRLGAGKADSFAYLRATKVCTNVGLEIFANHRYIRSALKEMDVKACNPWSSAKLEREAAAEYEVALS